MKMVRIEHYEEMGGTDAMIFAHLAHAQLIKDGATTGDQDSYSTTERACIARDLKTGNIMGILIWGTNKAGKYAWITGTYVKPEYRRRGINARMFKEVCKEAKKINLNCISGLISVNNSAMIMAAKKQGRKMKMVLMEMSL